jgi:uncharacterized phage protein gp47/JayE
MAVAPAGVALCTNPEAFSGGMDAEDDESLRSRVLATYRRLANGANAAYYEQQAMAFDEVSAAMALPRARGIGTVDVIVAARGGIPEQELLDRIQTTFDEIREIAVDVQVRGPGLLAVNIDLKVRVAPSYDPVNVINDVKTAVANCFGGEQMGKDVLLAKLGAVVFEVPGVENYAFSAPYADVAVAEDVLPVLGALTVEAMD